MTTDDPEWADRMRRMSLHGLSRDAWKRYTNQGSWYYEIVAPGFKYNLTDMAAALGLSQLQKAERFWKDAGTICHVVYGGVSGSSRNHYSVNEDGVQHAWHLYVIQLDLDRLRIGRQEFIEGCSRNRSVAASISFPSISIRIIADLGIRPL